MIEHGIEGTLPRTAADMKRVDRVHGALGQKDKLMKEVRSHLRLNPNPHADRVRMPAILDRFNHNRTQQRYPTQRYFTSGRNVPGWPAGDVLDQENPFTVYNNSKMDLFTNMFRTKKSRPINFCSVPMHCSKGCECKPVSEICMSKDPEKKVRSTFMKRKSKIEHLNGFEVNEKLTRLQVPTYDIPQSKIDLEADYFECVKGRPLRENFSRSNFNRMQRMVFFQSLYMGYFQDDIRRREEQFKLDMWELEKTDRELDRAKKIYEYFITEAHSESVSLVKEQLTLEHIRQAATAELNKRKGEMTGLKSNLYKRDYKLSEVLLCRDLLLKLSPPTFRVQYSALVARNKKRRQLKDKVISLYSDYCRYNPAEGKDFFLDEAIKGLMEDIHTLGPPKIYFKHRWELDMVMRKMELDCVAQVADIATIDDMHKEIIQLSKQVSKYYSREKRMILAGIQAGEEVFRDEKLRSIQLVEDANNDLNTLYKEVTCGDSFLETIGLVEVLHQEIFGPSKQKFNVTEMMNQIEMELHKLEAMIMDITPKTYAHYEKKVKKRLARERDEPIQARRRYRETKTYIKRIARMFDKPAIGIRWRRVVPRSVLPPIKKRKKTSAERRASDQKFCHLQLDKICMKDDVEEDIEFIIKCHQGVKPKEIVEMEDEGDESFMRHSSLRSSVDTESIEKLLGSGEEDGDFTDRASFDILELGYDSDEMLIRENVEKLQKKGLVEEVPDVLYDVRTTNDRFIVEGNPGADSVANKDRRHTHRPEHRANFNQLSWR